MAIEVIPRIWEKCTRLRKLRFEEISSYDDEETYEATNFSLCGFAEFEETNEALRNFHQLIYQLQVRGLSAELQN